MMVSCPEAFPFLIKFENGDEFLGINISYKPVVIVFVITELRGVKMYGLASTDWLISLRLVLLKLLQSIPK